MEKTHLFVLFLNAFAAIVTAGVMHSSHTHELHKERESDGSYSPRSHDHFGSDGQHHNIFDHEAIVGSHKEVEQYDQLSEEESKSRLRVLLLAMDLTGDGLIDKKEMKAWIIRSFQMLSEEESHDRMDDADTNRDGKVSWTEYLSDTYGIDSSGETLTFSDENEHLISDDKDMWKAADVNNDGVLNSTEWLAFTHPEEHPIMLPVILNHTLRDKDLDHDQAISFQEFIGDRGVEHDKNWIEVEHTRFTNELDKDKDGKLTGNEILSWIIPSSDEIADEEVDHLFAASDDDHDGVLTFDEAIDHHDVFVGSEATDYGEHLNKIEHFSDEL